ncbi:TetR family transcriptional regulator [Agarivorans sp. B2Z047]|uniref:TetR/AcrR family transcriptional regulator n=1 Tax=Agarivorans sp. B2Z047 TaxID=2652721 RepID=UPI00128C7F16|nr:TetR/AcrR family transcriptional regulator [Agarivorans sp. B2Z047]MPW29803.1 TetR family transcriptional regulator [Agarivorans sp. B2Z047]UQN43371.1 TetR/AcrR family transcriptional regulator [Agarivorans sp. B2Z047]
MPKLINHDEKRKEIALKATEIFLEYGYKNIGMRQLCEQLGMSKSAVYHYYKSKDQLFIAATEAIVSVDASALIDAPLAPQAKLEQRLENFVIIFRQMAPRFFKEMQLIADYIEVIGEENVASDACMQLANQNYLELLASYVSEEAKDSLYTLMLGLLNHQIMAGKPLEKSYIIKMVSAQLNN